MTAVEGRAKKEGSIVLGLLLGCGPLVLGALLAYGVWSLTGRLVGGSFLHYLWRLPLCASAFCAPLGILVQWMFGQREDMYHRDTGEPPHPPPPADR